MFGLLAVIAVGAGLAWNYATSSTSAAASKTTPKPGDPPVAGTPAVIDWKIISPDSRPGSDWFMVDPPLARVDRIGLMSDARNPPYVDMVLAGPIDRAQNASMVLGRFKIIDHSVGSSGDVYTVEYTDRLKFGGVPFDPRSLPEIGLIVTNVSPVMFAKVYRNGKP